MSMAKKKIEDKDDGFDIHEALESVNEFMREGFKEYIWDKGVKTEKEFKKLLKEYGG